MSKYYLLITCPSLLLILCRLRGCGFVFSKMPTDAEIEKVRKDTEVRKDVEGIDTGLILSPTKKRRTDGEGAAPATKPASSSTSAATTATKTGGANSQASATNKQPVSTSATVKQQSSSSESASKPKKVIQYNSSDEEGDF